MSIGRDAAMPLPREVEAVWDRLRVEFALHDDFWLAFLFGTEPPCRRRVAEPQPGSGAVTGAPGG
ncbi:MAG: hypothetical protein M3Z25_18700, partial [Actinomycetota bacterium]|nr:hypothetical protein [Actinomycetota bacterium]